MLAGDPTDWIARFRSLDIRFLERVLSAWPRCVAALPANPDEDTITINLVDILSRDAKARRLFHHLAYQHEPFGYTADGWAYSKGKIDMALLLDQERERYLAYECKRLNVVQNGKKRSLATPYVLEGMVRFVTEQYAADLPVGCMLGYVLDGNVSTARTKICAAIKLHNGETGLVGSPIDDQSVGSIERLSSYHCRPSNGARFEIRHALLPFPQKPLAGKHVAIAKRSGVAGTSNLAGTDPSQFQANSNREE